MSIAEEKNVIPLFTGFLYFTGYYFNGLPRKFNPGNYVKHSPPGEEHQLFKEIRSA